MSLGTRLVPQWALPCSHMRPNTIWGPGQVLHTQDTRQTHHTSQVTAVDR